MWASRFICPVPAADHGRKKTDRDFLTGGHPASVFTSRRALHCPDGVCRRRCLFKRIASRLTPQEGRGVSGQPSRGVGRENASQGGHLRFWKKSRSGTYIYRWVQRGVMGCLCCRKSFPRLGLRSVYWNQRPELHGEN